MKLRNLILVIAIAFMVGCTSNDSSTVDATNATATVLPDSNAQGEPVRVGILAIRSAVAANEQYGPILKYLEQEINKPVELVPVDQQGQFTAVEQKTIDFTLNNPLAAVQIRRLYDTEFLATITRPNTGPEFSGLIITHPDSDITTVDDLRDKKAGCVAFETAAAGCIFQMMHLREQGFDPFVDFSSFTEIPSQDNIVLGVLNKTIDVGFIRTGQLERMVREGTLLSLDEVAIFDRAEDDFYFPHTTALYPEWPFAALSSTDPELKQQVEDVLLAMPSDHPALVNAGITGFIAAVDYSGIDEIIETLQLYSWDANN